MQLNSEQDSLAIARTFKGTKNSDWTPIIKTFDVKGIEFEMCLVPPGRFIMGSDSGSDSEKPAHSQEITEPYWIGLHPVTNEQWRTIVAQSGGVVKMPEWKDWYDDKTKGNHPVVGITGVQCRDFAKWLGWRLPTELEWEYAARGLDNLDYPFGNEFKPDLVVYSDNSNNSTAAIGGRPKGAAWVGAQDMSGNVWDWTNTIYHDYPYKVDDKHENLSSDYHRVIRGGAFLRDMQGARAASRYKLAASTRFNFLGFRLCASPITSGL